METMDSKRWPQGHARRPAARGLGRCVALLGLLAGCGGDPTGAATTDLVGDWFACFSPDCTTLDRRGVRFESGGRYANLSAPREGWTPPGTYCLGASPAQRGTYTRDAAAGTLRAVSDTGTSSTFAFTVDPSGRTAAQTFGGDSRRFARIAAATDVVDCPP